MLKNEQLTEKILCACFNVINALGAGFLESVYEKALIIALTEAGLQVKSQVPLDVYFHDQRVGGFFADLLVEEQIIVEIKAVKSLLPEHHAQLINYLHASGKEIGLLVNFGKKKLEYHRLYGKQRSVVN